MLYKDEQRMNDNKPFNSSTAKAQALATMGLTFPDPDSRKFETL